MSLPPPRCAAARAASLLLVLAAACAGRLSRALELQPCGRGTAPAAATSPQAGGGGGGRPRDVVICRGVGDLSLGEIAQVGTVWARLASRGVITATSPLLYYIDATGRVRPSAGVPNLTAAVRQHITDAVRLPDGRRARSLPHIFCDTQNVPNPQCSMPQGVVAAMDRREAFFAESVRLAEAEGHDGFALDLEGSWGEATDRDILDFLAGWKRALSRGRSPSGHPLELHVWSERRIMHRQLSHIVDSIVDMNGYWFAWRQRQKEVTLRQELDGFCSTVAPGKCSAGLITYAQGNQNLTCADLVELADFARRRDMRAVWLWSGGVVGSHWEAGLARFAGGPPVEGDSWRARAWQGTGEAGLEPQREGDGATSTGAPAARLCSAHGAREKPALRLGPESRCDFDAQFTCDGEPKPRRA